MGSEVSFWVAGLTGGLAGALATQVITLVKWFALSPRLEINIGKDTVGCRVPVVGGTYFRAKIINNGNTIAKNVRVLISGPGEGIDEVYDAPWSGLDVESIDIPSKTYRFCDLFFISENGQLVITTRTNVEAPQYKKIGTVSANIHASAENSGTSSSNVNIHYSGSERSTILL